MIWILAALLVPLYFTAPADTLGADESGRVRVSRDPVRSYLFLRIDDRGAMVYVFSRDAHGNLSAPSNVCVLGPPSPGVPAGARLAGTAASGAPIVGRKAP